MSGIQAEQCERSMSEGMLRHLASYSGSKKQKLSDHVAESKSPGLSTKLTHTNRKTSTKLAHLAAESS